jgi:23S rRNA-/tRNA-specific pseudouridylate synthase
MQKPLKILFEDEDLIAAEKPAGLLVHPNPGENSASVADFESLLSAQVGRPIVLYHRLDRLSSGLLLAGKTRRFNREMRQLFDEHRVRKSYRVVVEGAWPKNLNRLGGQDSEGKEMQSTCRILKSADTWTVMEFLLKTGRRHQIRLQCRESGCPVCGDAQYGSQHPSNEWIALHCEELRFQHPGHRQEIHIHSPPPLSWKAEWLET